MAAVTPSKPEKIEELGAWLKHHQGSYGGVLNPPAMTFCQCCGSQYLDENGLIYNSKTSGHHGPTSEDVEAFYAKKYGPMYRTRFGSAQLTAMIEPAVRINKPGVTIAYMAKDKALDYLYRDPALRKLANGYEINDPAFKHPVSVLWVTA